MPGSPSGTFDQIDSSGVFYAGEAFEWTYDGIDTFSLESGRQTLLFSHTTGELTIIPEPSALILALAALAALGLFRRSRRPR